MRLNVDIKKSVYDELSRHCNREGKSLSEVVRSLITGWNAKKRVEEIQILQAKEVNDERSRQTG